MMKLSKACKVMMPMMLSVALLSGCGEGSTKTVEYPYEASQYISLGEYKGLSYTENDFSVKDGDLENVIDQVREQYMEYELVDRPAREGDKVVLDFDSYISGQRVTGFSAQSHEVYIGSHDFLIDGFEEALIGLSAGEERAITGLKVPEDFTQAESYAGRAITFNISITGVYGPVLPEYTDSFVTNISDGEYTTVEAYNGYLLGMLEDNAVENAYNDKYNQLFSQIEASSTKLQDFPAEYVEEKRAQVNEDVLRYTTLYNMTEEEYLNKYYGMNSVDELVDQQIFWEFIMQQVIEKENLKVTQKYYNEHLEEESKKHRYNGTDKYVEIVGEEGVVKNMLATQAVETIMNSAVAK